MPINKDKIIRQNIYDRWYLMKSRCDNANNISYPDYGGRGIEVCAEWYDFETFYQWSTSNGYSKELQLDRINNDEGYGPNNCRWVTPRENSLNRRKPKHQLGHSKVKVNIPFLLLKEKRAELSLSQKEVAERVGVSRTAYAHMETGERKVSVAKAKRIGSVMNIDWKLLYEDKVGSGIS